jgi:hypothetical protein
VKGCQKSGFRVSVRQYPGSTIAKGGVGFLTISGGGPNLDPSSSSLYITSRSLSTTPIILMSNFFIRNLSHPIAACCLRFLTIPSICRVVNKFCWRCSHNVFAWTSSIRQSPMSCIGPEFKVRDSISSIVSERYVGGFWKGRMGILISFGS